MPLVPAKCTQCGGDLQIDNTKEAAVCPYCGSAFVVEKAIHNYQITNHNNNYIMANNVSMATETVEQLADTGMKAINTGNYELARHCFEKIESEYPSDYRGPWGLILCLTSNLSPKLGYLMTDIKWEIEKKYKNACMLAPQNEQNEIRTKYEAFIQKLQNIEAEEKKKQQEKERQESIKKEEYNKKAKEEAFKILVIRPVRNCLIWAVIATVIYWSLPRMLWAILLLFYVPALGAILFSLTVISKNWKKWKKDTERYGPKNPRDYLSYFEEKWG